MPIRPATKSRVAIIADSIADGWGGSEELWSQAAARLASEGISVAASIHALFPLHDRVRNLMDSGVKLWIRPNRYSLWMRMSRRVLSYRKNDVLIEIERFLDAVQPRLV